ncbi:MAG: cell wall-binding repeat-containing protein [Candidatus Hydrothermarchaeales archaeon]
MRKKALLAFLLTATLSLAIVFGLGNWEPGTPGTGWNETLDANYTTVVVTEGGNVTKDFPNQDVTMTFENITGGGTATVIETSSPLGDPLPSNFQVVGHYYDISVANATWEGEITICITDIDVQSDHKLFHWEVSWMDVTTEVDPDNDKICGRVSTLSPFAIVKKRIIITPPGGGGAPAVPTPPPCFTKTINIWSPELSRCILEERRLKVGPFYLLPTPIAASLALVGKYLIPSNPIVQAALPRPLEMPSPEIYESSAKAVMQRYLSSKAVIIARGDLLVDSMAAVAFAKSQGIPILLTKPGELPDATLGALKKLDPDKIIIAGGPVAVSYDVEANLAKLARVERIWGESRYETAVELAGMVEDPEVVVVTDGNAPSADALMVSAEYKAPLLYVDGARVPSTVKKFILDHKVTSGGKKLKVVFVGVNDDAVAEIQGFLTMPKFMVEIEIISKLYQTIRRLLS